MVFHRLSIVSALTLTSLAGLGCSSREPVAPPPLPRHVIFLLGDGMGPSQVAFARHLMLGPGERFAFEEFPVTALVSTHSANNAVTDSSAAATAIATGVKINNLAVGVDPAGNPLTSLADRAKDEGWRVGYVTNTAITHATPASFYAAVQNRYTETDQIALDLLQQAPDLALGGGWRNFLPSEASGRRQDGQDLLAAAEAQGYAVWRQASQLDPGFRGRVLGLFAARHLPLVFDRERIPEADRPPTLRAMAEAALAILSAEDRPFFLLLEGGRIDHAGHSFDAKSVGYEIADFDRAVEAVIAFADEHPDTLVLATADHATGGLGTGDFVDWSALDRQLASVDWIADAVRNPDHPDAPADLRWVHEMLGFEGVTLEDLERVRIETNGDEASRILGRRLGAYQGISWVHALDPDNTDGHTGEDVALYAMGPGAEHFQGVLDNVEISRILVDLLGWSAADLDKRAVRVEARPAAAAD